MTNAELKEKVEVLEKEKQGFLTRIAELEGEVEALVLVGEVAAVQEQTPAKLSAEERSFEYKGKTYQFADVAQFWAFGVKHLIASIKEEEMQAKLVACDHPLLKQV